MDRQLLCKVFSRSLGYPALSSPITSTVEPPSPTPFLRNRSGSPQNMIVGSWAPKHDLLRPVIGPWFQYGSVPAPMGKLWAHGFACAILSCSICSNPCNTHRRSGFQGQILQHSTCLVHSGKKYIVATEQTLQPNSAHWRMSAISAIQSVCTSHHPYSPKNLVKCYLM